MPAAIYILGLSIFAQGTSELLLAGLLPELAGDLGVSIPRAGLLISAFALGMLVGAPVLAVATLRLPRRPTLLAFLGIFVVAHVVAALTDDYWVLFGTRIIAAFVYAGFWALAAAIVVDVVPADARGKAMSVVAGGLTVATIVGLPAGTIIGQQLGWRAAFWAVAALSAATIIGVLAAVPGGRASEPPRLRGELRTMTQPRLWPAYGSTALTTSSAMAVFAYLGAALTEHTGIAAGWVPAVLGLYGLGSLIGITVGGRTADAHPFRTLYASGAGMTVSTAVMALTFDHIGPVAMCAFLLGAFAFAANPALNTRVFSLAGSAPTLATATNVSAFNVGITVGPWAGGLLLGASFGYPAVAWLAAALGACMLATVAWSHASHRKAIREQAAVGAAVLTAS